MQHPEVEQAIAAFARGDVIGITGSGDSGDSFLLAVTWDGEDGNRADRYPGCPSGSARLVIDPGTGGEEPWTIAQRAVRVARTGGVLASPEPVEAAVDIARLAGSSGAMVCETVPTVPLPSDTPLPAVSIEALVAYRWRIESLVERVSETWLPTEVADFMAIGYRALVGGSEHIVLVLGEVAGRADVLTRVHSSCLTGDVFSSLRCDCGDQLKRSMEMIAGEGTGIIVYNPTHEGRGTGLLDKLTAYRLQDQGFDTVEANLRIGHAVDSRHYGVDAQILRDLRPGSVRLLTNNPDKVAQLRRFGVLVTERVPIWTGRNRHNAFYLDTKIARLGHIGEAP